MRVPSTNPITLPFGSSDPPYSATSRHLGTDFSYLPDSTIYAPASGSVTLIPNNGNDGNGIYMTAEGAFLGMLHTSKYLVSNGQHVNAGDPIGIMGDTGFAQGVHLHFAAKVNGVFIDPMTLITEEKPVEMFNDGDRTTWLAEAYVQDVGQYSDLVGKVSFKEALEKMRNDNVFRMNSGDVTTGFAIFDGKPSELDLSLWTGQTFKKFQYEKLTEGVALMPPKGVKPLGQEVYVKE